MTLKLLKNVWIKITFSDNFSPLVRSNYFPPDCNVTIIDNNLKFLERNLNAHQYRVIVLGDFNVAVCDWINVVPLHIQQN
jgi:hypothetical protein